MRHLPFATMLTYAIQKVGYDYQQTDPQGATDLIAFMTAIDDFPWKEQHEEWDEQQDGPFPALVLQNEAAQRELWVTALGREGGWSYQLQAVSLQMRKGFFGKGKLEREAEVINECTRGELDRLCELFCDGQHETFDREVARFVQRDRERDA